MTRPSKIVSSVGAPSPKLRAIYARGATVRLEDGRDYLDLMNGKGCVTLGHHHPEVTEAIIENLQQASGCATCWSEPFEQLSSAIVDQSGIADARVAFFTTGTEACRAAVQCARKLTGRKLIASAGYHGWGEPWSLADGFLQPNEHGIVDFYFVPELLEQVLIRYRDQIAMVIASPDYVHLKPETLAALVRLARDHNVLYCSDDVKNGYRSVAGSALPVATGETADLYTFSKGLANGQRLSCLVGQAEVMQMAKHFTYTAYFDSTPIVAALTTLRVMRQSDGYARLTETGARLASSLRAMISTAELPIKVYGDGALLQLVGESEQFDESMYEACAESGLLLYDGDNQAISLATAGVLADIEARFQRAFESLAERLPQSRGGAVGLRRQFEAAFQMMDGATDAVPSTDAIAWLEAQTA